MSLELISIANIAYKIEYCINLRTENSFRPMCSRKQNRSLLPVKQVQIINKKLEVAATGEATVALLFYITNYLHIILCRRNAIKTLLCYLAFGGGCLIFENAIV